MWKISNVSVTPCPIKNAWTSEYANVILKIEPIESWTRTNFEGEQWDWIRDSVDYSSFRDNLFSAGPRKFLNLMRFYVHCSVDLDFLIEESQVPLGLIGIEGRVCDFMRTLLMNEDLGENVFHWLTHGSVSDSVFCEEIAYNPNIPLNILLSISRSLRMTFDDHLFAHHWERFPERFEMEREAISPQMIPVVRGVLVRGPELAHAMRDEDHSAIIDAIARCETWEEYEMMMITSSPSAIRMIPRTSRLSSNGLLKRDGLTSWCLSEEAVSFSIFFHDAYHLCRSGRDPSEISHISPSNGTWVDDEGEDDCVVDLAGVVMPKSSSNILSVQQFVDANGRDAWDSINMVMNGPVLIDEREAPPNSGIVSWIIDHPDASIGIAYLFKNTEFFRKSSGLALAISRMKIDGVWDVWSRSVAERFPDVFEGLDRHHYDLDVIRDLIDNFGGLDVQVGILDFFSFLSGCGRIRCFHGTSSHRYQNGFPGSKSPPIRDVGLIPPKELNTEEYESRESDLDIVFMSTDPIEALSYSFRSVGQDGKMGVESLPILIETDLDQDDEDVISSVFFNMRRLDLLGEKFPVSEFILGIEPFSDEGFDIVVTKKFVHPSLISRVIHLPEGEDEAIEFIRGQGVSRSFSLRRRNDVHKSEII